MSVLGAGDGEDGRDGGAAPGARHRAPPDVTIAQIEELLAAHGYEVSDQGGDVIRVCDPESGVMLRGVLEENIFFLTISCMSVDPPRLTPELMRRMLAAENGISTSSFQLYPRTDGRVAITLNNFCKLQDMGPEDRDDILSCVEFLMVDVMVARELIGDLAG